LNTRPATSFHKTHPATKVQLRNARQILLRQHGRVKRKKNLEIQIGSWNVTTMLKPGCLQEIAEQMLKVGGRRQERLKSDEGPKLEETCTR
jgi:hypothetical protein